ncbi:MAG: hypothetical protein IPM54_23220 [Polyangiaceae bacterium]|nr:hypothetical protein [Polyangiaceae bacterium]
MRHESTVYFPGEGKDFLQDCIMQSIEWCIHTQIKKVVIFSGTGAGAHFAATKILTQEGYSDLQLIAVTPPFGRPYRTNPADPGSPTVRTGIKQAMRDELAALGVAVVTAHLPFKGIHVGRERSGEWTPISEAYGVLGGGFALCVQAVLMACDAGCLESGERVVVASADTAFSAIACRTESFLSPTEGILVEHIICRPMQYRISKAKHSQLPRMWEQSGSNEQAANVIDPTPHITNETPNE